MQPHDRMTSRSAAAAAAALCCLAGCTISQLKQDVAQTQARIEDKQRALDASQVQQGELRQEQVRLASELGSRQLSLSELNHRLDQLQAANRRSMAATEEQREQKRRLDEQIRKHKQELAQIQAPNGLSDDDKRRRIEQLRQEIKKQLELQTHL